MTAKKYYWLKLHKDFFSRHDVKVIESMPNGKDYVLFYLKLLAESVSYEGQLRFSETIPYNEHMLSTITNTNVDIVKSAMDVLQSLNLVSILDDQTIYMEETAKMLGEETVWAKKKREYREKKMIEEKEAQDNCGTKKDNVRQEIELEIELETEIELDIEKDIKDIVPFSEIINYLNLRTGRKYRVTNDVRKSINARFVEGFDLQDFKDVIDKKCIDWIGDDKMRRYLQPSTLFGTKFQNYLNQEVNQKSSGLQFDDEGNML